MDFQDLPGFHLTLHELTRLKIEPENDLLDRVAKLIHPVDLSRLGAAKPEAAHTVSAWQAALDTAGDDSPPDEMSWLVLLLFLRERFDLNRRTPDSSALNAELRKVRTPKGGAMSLGGTWFEITRRLAATMYHLGRKGQVSEQNTRLLQEAINLLDFLFVRDLAANNPNTRRVYLGMRGVAHLLLAHGEEAPTKRHVLSCDDLEESGRLGDVTLEHHQYLIESAVHAYDSTGDVAYLCRAERCLKDSYERHRETTRLAFLRAQTTFRRGAVMADSDAAADALLLFQEAADACSYALKHMGDPTISEAYVRMIQGQAFLRLHTTRNKIDGTHDGEMLDRAIATLSVGGVSYPSALLLRSIAKERQQDYPSSLDDLLCALAACSNLKDTADVRSLHSRISAGIGHCQVQIGIQSADPSLVQAGCQTLLGLPADVPEVNIGSLVYGGKFLAEHLQPEKGTSWLGKIAADVELRMDSVGLKGAPRRFAASHAARLVLMINASSPDLPCLEKAYALQRDAIAATNDPPPDIHLLGIAGGVALQLGKIHLNARDTKTAVGYLQDAAELLGKSIALAADGSRPETFADVTAHSKLGEALVRLHAITGNDAYANAAILHLSHSRDLGNDAAELLGLLGDAYYRRGRVHRRREDLERAITLKKEASAKGHVSRENKSVAAAASMRLWEVTADESYVAEAVTYAMEAVVTDKEWPWPLFQLAEIAALPKALRMSAMSLPVVREDVSDIPTRIRRGDVAGLQHLGCMRAVHTREFGREVLGGRQKVYVLDDPHRLLSQTIVLKPTTRATAEREKAVVEQFGNFLRGRMAPDYFELPRPMPMICLSGDRVVYPMRRANGRDLGDFVIDWIECRAERPSEAFQRAVEFLAYFHAWGASRFGTRSATPRDVRTAVEGTMNQWARMHIGREVTAMLERGFQQMIPSGLPLVVKKDSHPENWLIERSGHVVMLDLEAQSQRPVLFEVAQLLEDYPFLEVSMGGWETRLKFCRRYLETLCDLGHSVAIDDGIVQAAYAAFALLRAVFGMGRLINQRESPVETQSSSSLRATAARLQHYKALIDYLASTETSRTAREMASAVQRIAKEVAHGEKELIWD